MKADIKLCASSFSVVSLPVFPLDQCHLLSRTEEDEQHFTCVEQSADSVLYEQVQILMMLLDMSV
jgi:hypothetical protein